MLLFIYGTLKRHGSNHHYMHGQHFIDIAVTVPKYRLYDIGGYPGMVSAEQTGLCIKGEIWRVDQQTLKKLDELEDLENGEYAREIIQLEPPHDQMIVQGYRYLFSIHEYRDLGQEW